jgi:hypothetical protein
MTDNFELIADLMRPETKELDLGGYAKSKAGTMLTVQVNAVGVEYIYWGRARIVHQELDSSGKVSAIDTRYDAEPLDAEVKRRRKVVEVLFGMSADKVAAIQDDLLGWLYNEGWRTYTEYHAERRNFLAPGSNDTTTT